MKRHARLLCVTSFGALLLGSAAFPRATGAQQDQVEEVLDAVEIRERRKAIEEDTSLEESIRAEALAEFQQALDTLARASELQAVTVRYGREKLAAPALLEDLRAELARPAEVELPVPDPAWTTNEIESRRDAAAQAAAEAEDALEQLEARALRRSERAAVLESERLSARSRITEAKTELGLAPPSSHAFVTKGRDLRLRASIQEARAKLERLQAEEERNAAEKEMLLLQQDLARRRVEEAQTLLAAWDRLLREQRVREAEAAAARAAREREELVQRFPTLRAIADEVEELSLQLSGEEGLLAARERVEEDGQRYARELVRIRKSFADALERYEIGGSSPAFALFLRLESERLQTTRQLGMSLQQRRNQFSGAAYQALLLRERRLELGDVGARVQDFMRQQVDAVSAAEAEALAAATTELFTQERDLVGELQTNYEDYARDLLHIEGLLRELSELTETFEGFISSRILWVRSVDQPFKLRPDAFLSGFLWLLRGDPEGAELEALMGRVLDHWWSVALLLAAVAATWWLRTWCLARIHSTAPLVRSYKTDSLVHTWKVVILTLGAALPVPVLLLAASWILNDPEASSIWRLSWASGLRQLASFTYPLLVLATALQPDGLVDSHLRWPRASTAALSGALRKWLFPALVPAALSLVLLASNDSGFRDTTARLLFLVSAGLACCFAFKCLAPRGTVLGPYRSRHPKKLVNRARYVILVIGLGAFGACFAEALLGYFFTARVFGRALLASSLLVLAVLILHGIAVRWLLFNRRRLAIDQALQRRQEREEEKAETTGSEIEVEVGDEIDISALDSQTRTLFRSAVVAALLVGLLTIWQETLPALSALERFQLLPRIELLSTSRAGSAEGAQPGGTASIPAVPRGPSAEEPADVTTTIAPRLAEPESSPSGYRLTLADLLLALLLSAATLVTARNVPSLLEIGVLTKLRLDAGARYTITTLVRWCLVGLGASLALGSLGIGWSSVQWLAAALTFGLAFGLQEIFANFISGLILLVERPVRVGDTVSIGSLQGVVARIRVRATTILDYDNREHLIPNKTLITSDVTNWTLSDSVTRVVIPVGVAYGSDTGKVFEMLLRAASESPFALEDPAPTVLFQGFGESTLDFELRFFIPNRGVWVDAMNDANRRVDDLFRAEDIEIAFPQRDLHLRSSEPTPSASGQTADALAHVTNPAPSAKRQPS